MEDKKIIQQLELEMSLAKSPNMLADIKETYYKDPGILRVEKADKKQKTETGVKSRRKIFGFASAIAASLAVIIMAAVFLPGLLNGDSDTPTPGLAYTLIDDSYYEVSIGTATAKNIVIASEHNGKPVKRIAGDGFMNTDIESVKMPDCITVIGDGFDDGEIPVGAFARCKNLVNVVISKNITSIGDFAFAHCYNLKSILIPDSVTSIGYGAFVGCTSLKSVTIGNGVTSIGEFAFSGCTELTSIIVSDGNTVYKSVNNCILTKDGKTLILGSNTGVIPSGVTSIGNSAFGGCTGLTNITIPDSVTSIGSNAFSNCTDLTSVAIGNGVTSIGDFAFRGCTELTSIIVSDGNTVYKSVNNCLLTKDGKTLILGFKTSVIPNSVTSIDRGAFSGCAGLTSVIIPNNVKSIDSNAFSDCTDLTSVTIGNGVTSISGSAFYGCTGLTSIIVSDGNTVYKSVNNCLLTKDGKTLILGCKTSVIPNSVISIGNSAFGGCTDLTSVTIPDSVTSIGNWAFYNCTGLTSITIPDSVTSIGWGAFFGCTGLTSIIIPNNVKSIGSNAFSYCTGLTNIVIPDSVTSIGNLAFVGCTGLTSVTIPDSVTSIGENAFQDCSKLTIYCEAESKPAGWSESWNPDNRPVVWGYKG